MAKNINELLNIEYYFNNDDYIEIDINKKEDLQILCINDIILIELLSTNNILKVFYIGQDDKYFFVCNLKETDGFITILPTNKYTFKILKENIKKLYRRNNIKHNAELTYLYNLIK